MYGPSSVAAISTAIVSQTDLSSSAMNRSTQTASTRSDSDFRSSSACSTHTAMHSTASMRLAAAWSSSPSRSGGLNAFLREAVDFDLAK
jgi:hypothetical protein